MTTEYAGDPAEEPQGIDGIIARVDGYMQKPETVTPETLAELRSDLEDLKLVLEPQEEPAQGPAPTGGLAGMIGGAR